MSGRAPVEIVCRIVRDDPAKPSIVITDGTTEPDPRGDLLGEREKWFWIPRSEILDCDPPPDMAGEAPVTLTIPEWLALDRGLI